MIAAIVLAAGYSSRMGRFKPLLPVGGTAALERVLDLFLTAGIGDITVVTGHCSEALAPLLARKAVRAVYNSRYDAGMYSSVAAGVGSLAAQVDACFVLPADMPLVRLRTVQRLVKAYESHRSTVIYPVFQGRRGHPPLICRRILAETVRGDQPGGLRVLLARHEQEASEVAVIDEGIHLDLDTPADLVRALALADCSDAPSQAECEAILVDEKVGENVVSHCRVIAGIAGKLALRLTESGLQLDLAVVRAAGLLYHVTAGHLEYPKVAHVIACHQELSTRTDRLDESAIVYLAGRLAAGETVVSLAGEIEARSGMSLQQILASSS